MKLFIVGNGFDLNFGLPTRLADFGAHLQSDEQDVFSTLSGVHGLIAKNGDVSDLTEWNYLETRMANFDESFIIDQASYSFDRQEVYPPPSDDFWAYAADHFDDMVNPVIHELPWLVRKWALSIDIFDTSNERMEAYEEFGRRHQAAAFITFNYTRVLEDICQLQHVHHVHGEAEAGDVVLGHSTEFVRRVGKPGDIDEISELYPGFESYNHHFRKRQDELFKGVSDFASRLELDRRVDEVIVCGHSIGEADRKYFLMVSHLIPAATWTFTPLGGSGGKDHENIASLTSDPSFCSGNCNLRNLADIIGE
ncbi:AbiH family protein [Celeribacter marinus]|uniref:Uncharacterized protein n=1 Tax=Celeribacter marinus TaxID=1397108 RepID=A0A0P0AA89_9RHOB|nr:AbiH family protein [Celeribacter marinus]ALI54802.1 hypothetical protein IMCC12053_854 [Celeribacter marinus]SFJ98709.1 Bacteriophage abortive infection AbiH [Celeribacter marinus]